MSPATDPSITTNPNATNPNATSPQGKQDADQADRARLYLTDPMHMADLLEHCLPADQREDLELASLSLHEQTGLNAEERENLSDLVFSCATKGGGHALLYVLIERKGDLPAPSCVLQALKFMLDVANGALKGTDFPGSGVPSRVLPLAIRHDREEKSSEKLRDFFAPGPLGAFVPNLSITTCHLEDVLRNISEAE